MQSRTQLVTPSSLRLDSRLPLELRSISFQILPQPPPPSSSHSNSNEYHPTQPPAQADGYAKVSHGLTTVSSAVYGPREPQRNGPWSNQGQQGTNKGDRGTVNVEVGVVGWTERVGQPTTDGGLRKAGKDRRTIELAHAIKNTFEPVLLLHLYPRSSIDIYIQVLENDGSVLQAAINATTLSLISSGLPLSDYVCALTLASYPSLPPLGPRQTPPFDLTTPSVSYANSPSAPLGSGSTTLLDLVAAEESALPCLTVATLPRSGKITLVGLESRVSIGRFEEMLRWGVEGGKVVRGAMEEAVRTWANSLAAPSKTLGALFPGLAGAGGGGGGGGEDDDDIDL
ncbi:hypothetical protein JCM11641_007115 [Rhodosporidiobolus odoratus]